MGTKKRSNSVTEREGINYLRTIVEKENCIYHEIHKENDFGNDAIIELVVREEVKGICIGVQVKSGTSYCDSTTCHIPADQAHFEYWKGHTLQVIGVVYDPTETKAYWKNISAYLAKNPRIVEMGPYTISFEKSELNRLDSQSFKEIFLPIFLKQPVILDFQKSLEWCNSSIFTKHQFGVQSLFYGYKDDKQTWDKFIELFKIRAITEVDPSLLYFLALIPGHEDIFWSSSNRINDEIKTYVRGLISAFRKDDIVKLLSFIDENGISRGTIGQNIASIVTIVNDYPGILEVIALDTNISLDIRECATAIFLEYQSRRSAHFLTKLLEADDEIKKCAQDIVKMLNC